MLTYKKIDYDELAKSFKIIDGSLYRYNRRYHVPRLEKVEMKPTHNAGYHHLRWNRNNYLTHRIVYVLHHKKDIPEGMELDHINGNRIDNRIENLRLVNRQQNMMNLKRHRDGHYLGIHYDISTEKWLARVILGGNRKNIGAYNTEEEALYAQGIAYKMLYEHIDDSFYNTVNRYIREVKK